MTASRSLLAALVACSTPAAEKSVAPAASQVAPPGSSAPVAAPVVLDAAPVASAPAAGPVKQLPTTVKLTAKDAIHGKHAFDFSGPAIALIEKQPDRDRWAYTFVFQPPGAVATCDSQAVYGDGYKHVPANGGKILEVSVRMPTDAPVAGLELRAEFALNEFGVVFDSATVTLKGVGTDRMTGEIRGLYKEPDDGDEVRVTGTFTALLCKWGPDGRL